MAEVTFGVRGVWDASEFRFEIALCFSARGEESAKLDGSLSSHRK